MNEITVDLAHALVCDWLQLRAAFEPLHCNEPAEVSRLHDIYRNSVVAPQYNIAIPGKHFDERTPRPGDNFTCIISPLPLIRWIKEVSAKRGFPYDDRTALNIIEGKV